MATTTPINSKNTTRMGEPAGFARRRLAAAAHAIAGLVAGAVIVGSPSSAGAERVAAASEPVATGHSQVVAQGVVTLADGPYRWVATPHTVDAAGVTVDVETAAFVLAVAGSPVTTDVPDGSRVRLGRGEALFAGPGARTLSNGGATDGSTLTEIALSASDGAGVMTPGAGDYDVDLVRDVVAPGESFAVPASGLPVFVLVTNGALADGQGNALPAGQASVAAGGALLSNGGAEPAVVVAAVVDPLGLPGPTAPGAEAPAAPEPTQPPAPELTAPETTEAPPVETIVHYEVVDDIDGDGLTNDQEAAMGLDPTNADTDDDRLYDGDEVNKWGTDPRQADTDCDDYYDGGEILANTDPNDATSPGPGPDGPFVC